LPTSPAASGELLDVSQIKTFAMYVFDFGAPVGVRLTLNRPEAVKASRMGTSILMA